MVGGSKQKMRGVGRRIREAFWDEVARIRVIKTKEECARPGKSREKGLWWKRH
jgi:hypothetical protein